jgi:hypothetical protein
MLIVPLILFAAVAQDELSIPDANRIPVPQPRNVRLERHRGVTFINWDVAQLKRITSYEVFQESSSDQSPTLLARVTKPPFALRDGRALTGNFFVVAIDYRNNRSRPSQIVSVPTDSR